MALTVITLVAMVVIAGIGHHYALMALRRISVQSLPDSGLRPIVVFVGLAFLHIAEIAAFAATLSAHAGDEGGGVTGDAFAGSAVDWLYLAALLFTTLGYAAFDIAGNLRMVAASGSLLGFMLLTWSATFLFAECQKVWNEPKRSEGT